MGDNGSPNKKVANGLVALSSAAVLAVYGAGYARTRAAADRFNLHAAERRPHIPARRDEGEGTARPVATPVSVTTPAPPPAAPATAGPSDQPRLRERVAHALADGGVAPVDFQKASAPPAPPAQVAKATRAPEPVLASTAPSAPAAPAPAATAVNATDAAPSNPSDVATAAAPAPSGNTGSAVPASPAPAGTTPAVSKYRDGTYLGWGTSRHGDIQAAVVIDAGRITVARVAQCLTRYSCSWIAAIPPVIIQQQGTTYDYVSGATESSDAFQDAVADALSHAQ